MATRDHLLSRSAFRWIERGLIVVGLVLVGLWLKGNREAYAFQSAASRRLDLAVERHSPEATATPRLPTRGGTQSAELGGSLGRIEIPRLRISGMIAEGTSPGILARAVGHAASTPRPGSPGNVGLAGHRDTFFRGLGGIREHDLVRIVTPESTYTYRVEWAAIVGPHRLDVLDSTATPSLTLITCFPFHLVGPAPKRFVVRALSADAAVAIAPRPAASALRNKF